MAKILSFTVFDHSKAICRQINVRECEAFGRIGEFSELEIVFWSPLAPWALRNYSRVQRHLCILLALIAGVTRGVWVMAI